MNRQRRTTWESRSLIGPSRSRSRTERSWLRGWMGTCPNAGKLRFDTSLTGISGNGTLLHESRISLWRYGPLVRAAHEYTAALRSAACCTGCTQGYTGGVYRGCTLPGTLKRSFLLKTAQNQAKTRPNTAQSGKTAQNRHPSSVIRHPSSGIDLHPSSVIRHPSSVINRMGELLLDRIHQK